MSEDQVRPGDWRRKREAMKVARQARREARRQVKPGEILPESSDEFERQLAAALATPAVKRAPSLSTLFGSRVLGSVLDDKLAKGVSPETSPLLAERATVLAEPGRRRELAQNWLRLLDPPVVVRAGRPVDTRVPINYPAVVACEYEIHQLVAQLQRGLVAIRGVAKARALLCDGWGPVYNPASQDDLRELLREVLLYLDPTYHPNDRPGWVGN